MSSQAIAIVSQLSTLPGVRETHLPGALTRDAQPSMTRAMDTLTRLETTIAQRRGADPSSSYVAQLQARGLPVIARKLGEEAVETVVAALSGDGDELVGEAADLLFHLLVLLAEKDIPLAQVLAELDRRDGLSGLDEKASRSE